MGRFQKRSFLKTIEKRIEKRSFNDRFQKRLTTLVAAAPLFMVFPLGLNTSEAIFNYVHINCPKLEN